MAEFDFVVKNGLVVNTAFTANSTRVALGSNVVINTSSVSVSNSLSNVRISESSIIIGNTVANVTINSTSFTGIANNVSFVGTTAAAAVVNTSQLSANLANYVTTTNLSQNLVNYQTTAGLSANVATLTANNTSFVGSNPAAAVVNTAQLSANLANYQTTAGLAGNVATLTANNTSFVGSVSAANVVSNAQLIANLANYQTSAGLSANVARLSANNATFLNNLAATFYLNATNINDGTLAWARAPVNTVNTTGSFTFTGVQTFNGNTTFNSNVNIGTIGLIANGSLGTAGQVLHSNGSSAYWAADNEGVTSVATGNGMIGGTITTTGTVSILANTGIVANSTGTFVNAAYIGTLTANNTSFVGTTAAAAVVNTSQLSSNLANYATVTSLSNYQTTAGLSANVATLSSNNASFLGGVAASSYSRLDTSVVRTASLKFNDSVTLLLGTDNDTIIYHDNINYTMENRTGQFLYYTPQNFIWHVGVSAGSATPVASITNTGSFWVIGDITAYYSSDINLKENIKPISNALEKLKTIDGVTYDWKDEYLAKQTSPYSRKQDIGVIAQQIETIMPEIVATRDDGTKAVKYERIVALLIEAVKELSAEVEKLKKE